MEILGIAAIRSKVNRCCDEIAWHLRYRIDYVTRNYVNFLTAEQSDALIELVDKMEEIKEFSEGPLSILFPNHHNKGARRLINPLDRKIKNLIHTSYQNEFGYNCYKYVWDSLAALKATTEESVDQLLEDIKEEMKIKINKYNPFA